MEYTQDQKIALEELSSWNRKSFTANNDLFYCLEGSAGTGKTTIINDFIKASGRSKTKICVSAPTHKAKKKIMESTGLKGLTIQKILGLRPNTDLENFNINRPQFDVLARPSISLYDLIIIDESSMINSDLYTLLKQKAIKNNVRILYVGDSYQLPPIKERLSKVFSDVANKSILTTVVRQGKDNPMAEVLLALRDDIRKGTNTGINMMLNNTNNTFNDKGYKALFSRPSDPSALSFGAEMKRLFLSTEYEFNTDFVKFITYTNKNVELWSVGLRKELLKEASSNLINAKETLLSYKSILTKDNELLLENSAEYSVLKVVEHTSKYDINGYQVSLEDDEGYIRSVFVVNHLDKENLNKFREICKEKLQLAQARRGSYWKSFYAFKDSHLLLTDVYKLDNGNTSRENLLCKKDLYYNYGLTTHKSQGSTYENACINLNNLFICKDASTRARLIYVALSRAKNLNLIMLQ